MKSTVTYTSKAFLITLVMVLNILAAALPAHAYYYAGGDWGGRDLTLLNGDSLSGTFNNVGQFYIPTGALISGRTDNLIVNAKRVLIDGSLTGIAAPGYDLQLSSLTNIILNGSIGSWKSIRLTGNYVTVSATSVISSIVSTTSYVPVAGDLTLYAGGTISTGTGGNEPLRAVEVSIISPGGPFRTPQINLNSISVLTPIPATVWLLGSGLLGLAGMRRKRD